MLHVGKQAQTHYTGLKMTYSLRNDGVVEVWTLSKALNCIHNLATLNKALNCIHYLATLYFKTSNINSNTRTTSVKDKKGNEVETKYNVSSAQKNISYTLTLYHTTSTCLVNGKNTRQFIDSDF